MGRLAKEVVAVSCPPIPFTAAEVRREAFLWRLAAAFQALTSIIRPDCCRLDRQLRGGVRTR